MTIQVKLAIHFRGDGTFMIISLQNNHCWVSWWRWKDVENRSTFGDVMGKSRMSCFL